MKLMARGDSHNTLVQKRGREATGENMGEEPTGNVRHKITYFFISLICSEKVLILCFASFIRKEFSSANASEAQYDKAAECYS